MLATGRSPIGLGGIGRLLAIGAMFLLVLPACSSNPKPDRLSPQTMSATPPPEAEPLPGEDPREQRTAEAPDPVTGSTEAESTSDPQPRSSALMVVIEDETTERNRQPSLVEAAAAERKRRQKAGKPIAVITDKNLADFKDGQLTEMGAVQPQAKPVEEPPASVPATPPVEPAVEEPPVASDAEVDPETYWRGRILRARMNWASAVEETEHLEVKIAELRQRFYAEDDPYYRDAQIKPSWDRALDRLEEARAAIDQYRTEVRSILDEGRRASALPGWLREGIDLEPDVVGSRPENRPPPPGEYIPGEPKVAADPDGSR